MKKILLLSIVFCALSGCKSQQLNNGRAIAEKPSGEKEFIATLPHIVIYKTRNDYRHNVPVLLSEDKALIVSYPHPSDLLLGDKPALPSVLHKGYLLDNRGIQKNVAFLKYTYEEYSKLKDVPSLEELQKNIIDTNPLTELWDCGECSNFTDLQKQLNEWIDKGMLPEKFKRIK
jgi:hypothetical protein